MLVVTGVTARHVMATNPLRDMFGARGARRRISLAEWARIGLSPHAEVDRRAEDDR